MRWQSDTHWLNSIAPWEGGSVRPQQQATSILCITNMNRLSSPPVLIAWTVWSSLSCWRRWWENSKQDRRLRSISLLSQFPRQTSKEERTYTREYSQGTSTVISYLRNICPKCKAIVMLTYPGPWPPARRANSIRIIVSKCWADWGEMALSAEGKDVRLVLTFIHLP